MSAREATEAGMLSHPGWSPLARWTPDDQGWSVELPVDGEWSFVRTEHIDGRLVTAEFTLLETVVPTMSFRITVMDAGGAEYLDVEMDCDARITNAALEDAVAPGAIFNTEIAGLSGRIARASQSPPGIDNPGDIAYVCAVADEELYLVRMWSAPASTEFDMLSMLYSFRIETR